MPLKMTRQTGKNKQNKNTGIEITQLDETELKNL